MGVKSKCLSFLILLFSWGNKGKGRNEDAYKSTTVMPIYEKIYHLQAGGM